MKQSPVCAQCGIRMRVHQNGVIYYERRSKDSEEFAYKWHADSWRCPSCNASVLVGFAIEPENINPDNDDINVELKNNFVVIQPKEN